MENRTDHLWRPLNKFNKNTLWQDLDWAVQAQIRIQISAHLYSNMRELINEGLSLEEFSSLCEFLGLAPHLKTFYHLHKMAGSLEEINDLYALEEKLWSLFKASEHDCILTQALDLLTLHYSEDFSQLIARHYIHKHNIGNDFKNWFLHDGFKEIVRKTHREARLNSDNPTQVSLFEKLTQFLFGFIQRLG